MASFRSAPRREYADSPCGSVAVHPRLGEDGTAQRNRARRHAACRGRGHGTDHDGEILKFDVGPHTI